MLEYGFYTEQYLGSKIPEKAFPEAAARAFDALERLKRVCRVESTGETSENMALCAMAEAVYAASKRTEGVASASVGNVSVRYDSDTGSLDGELYRKAAIYLDIYRGVG